jgi:hypothetical protein
MSNLVEIDYGKITYAMLLQYVLTYIHTYHTRFIPEGEMVGMRGVVVGFDSPYA